MGEHKDRQLAEQLVNLIDQTAIPKDATGRVIYKDEVIRILRKHNFRVKEHRIWQASSHDDRF